MKPLELPAVFSFLALSLLCQSSPVHPDSDRFVKATDIDDDQAPIQLDHSPALFDQPWTTDTPDFSRSIPSWDTTHLLARRLLALSTTGTLATVFQGSNDGSSLSSSFASGLAGLPVALPDYVADCANDDDSPLPSLIGPGNPVVLALHVSTSIHNANAGSNISLSVDWWHHHRHHRRHDSSQDDKFSSPEKEEDPFASQASLPRLSLIGTLESLPETMPDDTRGPLEKCFLASHPDAVYWLPGNPESPHTGYWARLVVHEAMWVGGFGDRARIGWLDIDAWRAVRKNGEDGKRGWDDVRLPGEK